MSKKKPTVVVDSELFHLLSRTPTRSTTNIDIGAAVDPNFLDNLLKEYKRRTNKNGKKYFYVDFTEEQIEEVSSEDIKMLVGKRYYEISIQTGYYKKKLFYKASLPFVQKGTCYAWDRKDVIANARKIIEGYTK